MSAKMVGCPSIGDGTEKVVHLSRKSQFRNSQVLLFLKWFRCIGNSINFLGFLNLCHSSRVSDNERSFARLALQFGRWA